MKNKYVKLLIRISIITLSTLILTYFFVACSYVKSGISYDIESIQNSEFIDEDKEFKVMFRNDSGTFIDFENETVFVFNFEYSSGITRCIYYQINEENELIEKELSFVFIDINTLYSQTLNSYLIRSVD